MRTARITLIETIVGIWILAGIVILAGVFFVSNPLAYVLGELAGSLTASLMMCHLYSSLDAEMDLPEKKAVGHSRFMSGLRSAIEIAVLVGSCFIPGWVMPYTVLAGLFGRKLAAMAVPFYEEFRHRKKDERISADNKSD